MAKTDRYFEIIQLLRQAERPVLAQEISEALEVSKRTIYRDIAALQARQVPIYGEAGLGYVMRKGYDLPPLNLEEEEAEAVAVGLALVARTGDPGLWQAARRASRKLRHVAPGTKRLVASSWGAEDAENVDMPTLRAAIREERKVSLTYEDREDRQSERIVWPLVMVYYVDVAILVAWCEMRQDLRHFRLDRMREAVVVDAYFLGKSEPLIGQWEASRKADLVTTRAL